MEPKMKFFYPKVKAVDVDNRRITVCISRDEIDRHGERIEIQAISDALSLYATNPVVLGDHQHRLTTGKSSVIGHAPPDSYRVLENEVDMDIVFSTTENAETYWVNFRDGHQKAVSIGFIDVDWHTEDVEGRNVNVTTKMELLELSCVAVGANRGALVKAKDMFDRLAEPDIKQEVKNTLIQAIMAIWDNEFKELQQHVSKLTEKLNELIHTENSVLEGIEDIKSLLITDPDGLAERWLGKGSDSPDPAGDRIAEQFDRIQKNLKT